MDLVVAVRRESARPICIGGSVLWRALSIISISSSAGGREAADRVVVGSSISRLERRSYARLGPAGKSLSCEKLSLILRLTSRKIVQMPKKVDGRRFLRHTRGPVEHFVESAHGVNPRTARPQP